MEHTGKTHACPNCQSTSIYRSRRRGLKEFFFHHVLFMSPYRCKDCDTRFLHRRIAKEAAKAAPGHSPTTHAPHSA
jgi:predicted RNA-binding Zn-ribbon protein involved in translation (DUF1610 family)